MHDNETPVENRLERESFEPHVGSKFTCSQDQQQLVIELVEVNSYNTDDPGRDPALREPFSLIFRGPENVLPQAVYSFDHDQLGTVEIFIVPVGQDAATGGILYEAIFN